MKIFEIHLDYFYSLFCFKIGVTLIAQTKLNFNYDGSGNQISRTSYINCSSKSVQDVVEPEALTEND